jgi:hypothetical protein
MHQHVHAPHEKKDEKEVGREGAGGFPAWLAKYRRSVILFGATITLAMYFTKDVAKEDIKDELAAMNAGASEYRTNLSSIQQQTTELLATMRLLESDAVSLPRDKVLVSIASLTYRQELNANELFAFWKNMSDVPTSNLTDIKQNIDRTADFTKTQQTFAEHPPSDASGLQAGARSLVKQLTDLNDQTGKAGADLQVLELEESDRLKHKSSFYGYGITALYLFGLVLTVVSSLYGIELPKKE